MYTKRGLATPVYDCTFRASGVTNVDGYSKTNVVQLQRRKLRLTNKCIVGRGVGSQLHRGRMGKGERGCELMDVEA